MATLLSPGVSVSTKDLSQVTTAAGDSAAAFCGDFTKGPVNVPVLISSVTELKETFGGPTKANYNQWYQAYNFLQYSGELYVVRAADINGTPIQTDLVYNSNAFVGNTTETKLNAEVVSSKGSVVNLTEDSDTLKVNDTIKFGTDGDVLTVKSVSNKTIQVQNPDYAPLTTLDVTINKLSLLEGVKIPFDFETDGNLNFEVDPAGLITIDPAGKTITANTIGNGSVTLWSKREGYREKRIKYDFEIKEFKLALSSLAFTLTENESKAFTITSSAGVKTTLTVEDPTVAEISGNTITGKKEGTTKVILVGELDGQTKSVEVPVYVSVAGNTEVPVLTSTNSPILLGSTTTFTFTTTEATDTIIASADEGTVSVSGKTVTYVAPNTEGTYPITVKAVRNGVESSPIIVNVEVIEEPNAPVLAGTFDSIEVGKSATLNYTLENPTEDVLVANVTFGTATVTGNTVTYTAGDVVGNQSITAYATRKGYKSAETTTNFVIRPVKPVLASSVTDVAENKSLELDFTISAGDTLTATATNGTVSVSGSKVTYTAGSQGLVTLTVKSTKNSIESEALEVQITVAGAAPVV